MSLVPFLYILPELFLFLSSFFLLALGLISFSAFTGSYSLPNQKFSWGRFRKYSLDLRRGSFEAYSSFSLVVFLVSFFLCIICYDFFGSAQAVLVILFYGALDISYFTAFAKFIVSVAFFFFLLLLYVYYGSVNNLKAYPFSMSFESFYLMLLVLFSSLLLVSSANFLSFYLSLELQTLILYVLVSLNRTSAVSTEASLKYLILGALSTGLLLFGMSLFYGLTSLMNFFEISIFFSLIKYLPSGLFVDLLALSLMFIFSSFFFKFSVFPFHLWAPDVYEGSPTPVMIFIAVIGKFSILFLLVKFLVLLDLPNNLFLLGSFPSFLIDIFLLFSFLTVVVGSIGGLLQSKVKRLWGYSAITNLGFMFLALSSFSSAGFSSAALYLSFYTLLNFLFFSFYVSIKFRTAFTWSDLRYLGQLGYTKHINAFYYYLLCFILVSFLSFPPLLNFIMKVYVLWSVYLELTSPSVYIVVLFLLVNLIASFYYLRLYRFFVSQHRAEYFYAPIFYSHVGCRAYAVSCLFLCVYFLLVVYNNSIYTFLDLIFNSYSSMAGSGADPVESLFADRFKLKG